MARARRRSRVRIALLAIAGFALVIVVWSVVTAALAARHLEAARADIRRLTNGATPDRAALERRLQQDLTRANASRNLLGQPGPVVFGWIPILGRNITAERAVADASAAALRAGITLSRSTRNLSNGHGGIDIAQVRTAGAALSEALAKLQPDLHHLAAQPVAWTLPPVNDGVRAARNQLLDLEPQMSRAAAGLNAMAGVLGGNGRRTVAVILMNNAELRGAGGLPSAYATGIIDNGVLNLAPFRDVNTVAQPPARAVRVASPAEYHASYGAYLADTTLWKNTTMSPDDQDTAQVVAAAVAASLHVPPDVVVLCDVPAAAAVISATGPITIEGESVTGPELTRRLLVDAYGDGSLSEAKQQKRRQVLDDAATEAFGRLRHGATATPGLLRAIADAVAGRHLALWSERPDEERQLTAAGAAGSVDLNGRDALMLTTNNLGDSPSTGNKLDYYVKRDVAMTVRLSAHRADVTQTVVLRNEAPSDLGPYVEGVAHPGDVHELVSFAAADGATLTSFTRDGQSADVVVDHAYGAQQLTAVLDLDRGAMTTYRLTYSVPIAQGHYRLALIPQPLAQPAQLHLHVSVTNAELGVVSGLRQPVHGTVDLTETWDSVRDIDVPVHSLHGLRGLFHAIADFWSHPISF